MIAPKDSAGSMEFLVTVGVSAVAGVTECRSGRKQQQQCERTDARAPDGPKHGLSRPSRTSEALGLLPGGCRCCDHCVEFPG